MEDSRFDWQADSACRGIEPEIFFPVAEEDAWQAKEICAVCTVRSECLAYSLTNRERYGVWGGVTEKERIDMQRRGVTQRVLADAVRRAG